VASVTSKGRAHRVDITELPMTSTGNSVGGAPVKEYCSLDRGEKAVGLMPVGGTVVPALATAHGVVKRLNLEDPGGKDIWDVIALKPGDRVIAATTCRDDDELVFISSDAQLLHFPATAVRAQGRSAGGMAGMRLSADAQVIFFGAVAANDTSAVVVTVAGSLGHLAGTSASSIKVSAFDQFPAKGRGTGGVRCQRLVKGEDALVQAWVGSAPPRAESPSGKPIELPSDRRARDASGDRLTTPIGSLGGPL